MRLRTVSPVSVSLLAGVPAFLFGLIFGVASWAAGIVMLAALPLLIGFEQSSRPSCSTSRTSPRR